MGRYRDRCAHRQSGWLSQRLSLPERPPGSEPLLPRQQERQCRQSRGSLPVQQYRAPLRLPGGFAHRLPKRVNQPQLRADLDNPDVVAFAKHFGGMTVLHSPGVTGMLRDAAVKDGIIAVTMEAGGPNRLETQAVNYG